MSLEMRRFSRTCTHIYFTDGALDELKDHLLDPDFEKKLIKLWAEDRKFAILGDFEYARQNTREAFWYGPWGRVLAWFLCPVCITSGNKPARIECRVFPQHPAIADVSDLEPALEDENFDPTDDISLPSTRYVDHMVVSLSHPNNHEGTLIPLLQPSPRLVLGVELKNPRNLGRM